MLMNVETKKVPVVRMLSVSIKKDPTNVCVTRDILVTDQSVHVSDRVLAEKFFSTFTIIILIF